MELIKDPMIELDVYSSCEVYGKDFAEANDSTYQKLYDQAKRLKERKLHWIQIKRIHKKTSQRLQYVCIPKYMGRNILHIFTRVYGSWSILYYNKLWCII